MSLRYRLFLWVSGVFVVVATFSYFLENYITRRELAAAQQQLKKEILQMSENRRLDIQNFVAGAIIENQVRIDAILQNVVGFAPQALRFGPTAMNEKKGTWGDASDLILEYQWIDFLQNTNENKTTAEIIPQHKAIDPSYRIVIDEDLSWIYVGDLETHPEPYLGIRIPYSATGDWRNTQEDLKQIEGAVPEGFLLFDPAKMASSGPAPIFGNENSDAYPPIMVKWVEGYQLDVAPFVKAFQRACALARNNALHLPQLSAEQVSEKLAQATTARGGKLNPIPDQPLLSALASNTMFNERMELIALRYTQFNLIWVMIAMYDSGIFGEELFSFPSPAASAVFADGSSSGIGILTDQVLYTRQIFDDAKYYQNNPPKDIDSALAASLAVIPSASTGQLFLGNTAEFTVTTSSGPRTGYLTLGIDTHLVLQKLMMAMGQAALLVHDGAIVDALGENAKTVPSAELQSLPIATMLKNPSGIIPWQNQNYYYMHLLPFPSIDLHFFLLVPEAVEFALLKDLVTGSEKVVNAILFNLHTLGIVALFIVILLLHNISRRITKPIIQLAKATEDVVAGRLEEIELSLPPKKHQDEIAVLCHSFEEMVKGLQEKEKVKGVLNKVVSREIAQEILKGTVHLGGEEKKVTILFADIRDFTKMTQKMPPAEVIELLNVCMTRVSQAVDSNKGVIDKYVGDEAMALFGAPVAGTEDAFHAICSAIDMVDALKKWNVERAAKALPPIEVGIGIHTSRVLAGNMGAENRLNYTVIGSGVNLAARLCSAAKRMEILITKETLDEPNLKERVVYEEMPPTLFKGFEQPVALFRVLGIKK